MGNRLLKQAVAAALLLTLSATPTLAATTATAPSAPEAQASALVPLRAKAEAAGAVVTWDGETQTVTVTREGLTLIVRIGESVITLNGKQWTLRQPVQLIDGRTMVPQSLLDGLEMEATAKAYTEAMIAGKADPFVEQFTPELAKILGAKELSASAAQFAPFGAFKAAEVAGSSWNGVHHNADVLAQFEKAALRFTIRFDQAGKIDDMIALPVMPVEAPGLPEYADPKAYTDQEVVLGEGTFALPGTLTVPVGEGPFPAVVLVHGSGPNDRDETAYGVKPFRDIAYGLASRGVAVLRYEKRTREHGNKSMGIERLTVQEETIDDALEAVKLLGKTEGIDPQRIYVLGHSQGGLVLPRILDQGKEIAGGIMLGGPTNLPDVLVEQNRLIAETGAVGPEQVAFVQGQMAMVKDPAFDPANPPKEFALGMPYWWKDLSGDESALAKKLTTPMLILQGERDFQVPASELTRWQTALADRKDVTYKLFPKLNHFFTEGEGPISTMAEYMVPANVPVYVVDEISNWILK